MNFIDNIYIKYPRKSVNFNKIKEYINKCKHKYINTNKDKTYSNNSKSKSSK
jgi:hypothetical protein